MGVAARIAEKTIRLMNSAVDTAVLAAIMLLAAIGCYALWDSGQVYQAADAALYEIYKPTIEDEGLSFRELQAINPDVFAWLTVYGTNIDYPVVQGRDNMKYVNTNAEGRYSLSGAIFLDKNCSRDFSDFSHILYGHHMEKKTMFGEIGNFSGKGYFDARRYGSLFYGGAAHGLEFFAFVHADAYDTAVFRVKIGGLEERQAYLGLLLERALHTRDIGIAAGDRIVLLSTCSAASTNGRDILAGRITDELFDDPFLVGEMVGDKGRLAEDAPFGSCVAIPVWAMVAAAGLLLAALLLLAMMVMKRKRS